MRGPARSSGWLSQEVNWGSNKMEDNRGPLTTTLMVGGGFLIYAGIVVGSSQPGNGPNTMWAILLGLPFFIFGLITSQEGRVASWFGGLLEKVSHWFGISPLQVILLAMSPVLGYISILGAGFGKKMYSPAWSVAAWILGIAFVLIGGLRFREEKIKLSRPTVIWLIVLTVFAFLIRGIATDRIPVLLTGDEGSSGTAAVGFVTGEWNNIFVTSWFSFPSLFSFIQSLSIRIFGHTTEALRLVSALVGALTVGSVYLFGKSLFGQRTGIFAALVLSALHFHIHFSRIGLNNIWDGLWYILMVGALCVGWEYNKRWAYLLAGLALGFGQYFYVSSRGLFGIILAGIFIALLIQRKKLKQALPDIFLMVMIAVVVVLPLTWYFIHQPNQFLAPMARVSFLRTIDQMVATSGEPAWKILAEQIGIGLQAYTIVPVRFWYTPETPILRPISAALFYLGFVILLLRYRDSRSVLLGLWLIAFGVIAGLSESAPAAQRYAASAPACALIVGLGLHGSTEALEKVWQKYSKVFVGFSYAILCFAMLSDLYFYFIDYYGKDLMDNLESNGMIAQHVADEVKGKPAGTQVAFFTITNLGYYSIPSIQYLAPQVKGVDVPEPWSAFDKTQLNKEHIVFIFPPGREEEALDVTREYPNGYLYSETGVNGAVLFWVYDLP
jgi:4-amino-4-deoxy-L-arabinose transferase-like glycosyltransferase